MLSDYLFAKDLTLPDKLRLIADAYEEEPLTWAALHEAADRIESMAP